MVKFLFGAPLFICSLRLGLLGILVCMMVMACGGGGSSSEVTLNNGGGVSYSLSGTVSGPANAVMDWDVNDANAVNPNGSNNSLEANQPLNKPVSLAGYVKLAGDVSDFFSISLSDTDSIALYVADPDDADIDLYLYDERGEIKNSAMGDNAVEVLEINSDGDYIVEVRIIDMGNNIAVQDQSSNYNLVIGSTLSATASSVGMRLSDDFVSGEVVMQFKGDVYSAAGTAFQENDNRVRSLGMKMAGGAAGRPMRMKFDPQAETAAVFSSLGMPDEALKTTAAIADPELRAKQRTLEVVKALRQREDVLFAQPNYIRRMLITPDDTFYNYQWHYDQIHLPEAWDITTGSSDVIVAVIDSGVLVNHPDLAGKLTGTGYDFVSDLTIAGDGDGIDDNPDDPGDYAWPDNSSTFHGTHVAGTIGAVTDNGTGVAGAGWSTRVMAVRCLGLDSIGTDYDIAQGIRYAAGLTNDSGTVPGDPADIINLSLGSETNSIILSNAVRDARLQGVILIAAAGNEATDQPIYPAAYDAVISVSAVDYGANLAIYSSYGSTIDVAAPGGDVAADLNGDSRGDGVLSTIGSDGSGTINMVYGFYQGTSMAAPHVSAVVALMKALRPVMTPDELDAFLASGQITTDIGDPNSFGAGLIDAQKAVLAAQAGAAPTLLSVNPSLISLGFALSGATITAGKVGDAAGQLNVTAVSTDAPWLTVVPETVDTSGLGTYSITGDRNGLADGVYNGTITFVSSQNTVTASVTMQLRTGNNSTDTGYHYIRLVHVDTGVTAYETIAQEFDGDYRFYFPIVSPGDYFLYAGTDLDKDSDIRDAGEIVGAYPNLEQPQRITVDRTMMGLDFASRFTNQSAAQNP